MLTAIKLRLRQENTPLSIADLFGEGEATAAYFKLKQTALDMGWTSNDFNTALLAAKRQGQVSESRDFGGYFYELNKEAANG